MSYVIKSDGRYIAVHWDSGGRPYETTLLSLCHIFTQLEDAERYLNANGTDSWEIYELTEQLVTSESGVNDVKDN